MALRICAEPAVTSPAAASAQPYSVNFPERKTVLRRKLHRRLRPLSHGLRIVEMLMQPAVQMKDMTQSVGITQLPRRGKCRAAARYRLVYFAPPQQEQRDKIQRGDPDVRHRQEHGGSAISLI
jgi:hypothetical protein